MLSYWVGGDISIYIKLLGGGRYFDIYPLLTIIISTYIFIILYLWFNRGKRKKERKKERKCMSVGSVGSVGKKQNSQK